MTNYYEIHDSLSSTERKLFEELNQNGHLVDLSRIFFEGLATGESTPELLEELLYAAYERGRCTYF